MSTDGLESVGDLAGAADRIRSEIHKVVVGQDAVIDELLLCMFCGGHALLVGVPGLAKTLLISTIARTMNLGFSRIQFTPDLMPSDMTGTEVMEEDRATGARSLRFVKGPIFSNLILADEINRTPPKTQAALLEAMQERQVTAGGTRYELPSPFFVLATQNPIEQEGTYPLPEAQLDRFMFNIRISYPQADEEQEIVRRTTSTEVPEIKQVIDGTRMSEIQTAVRQVPIADHVINYAIRLARATRVDQAEDSSSLPSIIREYVNWGAGPRASQYLTLAAKAKAVLSGSNHVTSAHIKEVALPVLRHRILTNFNAESDGITTEMIINELLEWLPPDDTDSDTRKQMDQVMR
jgi:MoxR-like ATPase